jgi:acyl dehydratase
MSELFLEDLTVGQTFGSGRLRIDAETIKRFAAEFDPQPFHLDEQAARAQLCERHLARARGRCSCFDRIGKTRLGFRLFSDLEGSV